MRLLAILLLWATVSIANAQVAKDTLIELENTPKSLQAAIPGKRYFVPSPKRASLLAAVLPGAGQVYNRKYWKLPILYGTAVWLGWLFDDSNKKYLTFRDAYVDRLLGDRSDKSLINQYPNIEQLRVRRDLFRRDRDYYVILGVALYALQIADAAVDAHLASFDISDDLSMQVQPAIQSDPYGLASAGLNLTLTIK